MSQNHDNIINNFAKLQWACRRGMLELDVLLGNFLNERFAELTLEEKRQFVTLLEHSDPEIHSWIMGQETPADDDMLHITTEIRRHARSRF